MWMESSGYMFGTMWIKIQGTCAQYIHYVKGIQGACLGPIPYGQNVDPQKHTDRSTQRRILLIVDIVEAYSYDVQRTDVYIKRLPVGCWRVWWTFGCVVWLWTVGMFWLFTSNTKISGKWWGPAHPHHGRYQLLITSCHVRISKRIKDYYYYKQKK